MTRKVRIFRDHTHAGEHFPAGSEIELPDDAADYLLGAEEQYRAQLVENNAKYNEVMAGAAGDDR